MERREYENYQLVQERPLFLGQDFSQLIDENRKLKEILSKEKSENEALLSQISKLEKLSAIGANGATIAHELNNPLTIICAEADEILDLLQDPDISASLIGQSAQNIKNSSLRVKSIINHFQTRCGETEGKPWRKYNLTEIIEKSLELVGPQFRQRNIEIVTDLQRGLPEIWGEQSKLESIFQNLLVNAMDAFANASGMREKQIFISAKFVSPNVNITIRDTGCGIPANLRKKIFTPFFTTKKAHGTGLGLAIVAGYVKEHHGQINMNSAVNSGTEFILKFPLERRK